jgi:hypothetical protein
MISDVEPGFVCAASSAMAIAITIQFWKVMPQNVNCCASHPTVRA